jgi:putative drug exporter of the RND superfamily
VGEDVAVPQSVVGRVGRWCAGHAWWVLAAWVLAVAAGIVATGPLFNRLADGGVPRDVESVAAYDVIRSGDDSAGTVIGVIDRIDPASPQVRAAVQAAGDRIASLDGVREVDHPYNATTISPRSVATDGTAVLISATLDGLDRTARNAAVTAISAEMHALAGELPTGATVEVGGGPVLNMQTREAVQEDLSRAEYTSLPITLIVLVLVFGGVVAAGLPVLTAAVSVAVAMLVMLGFTTFTDVDQDGVTVVTLLGLGLAVDYGLLLVARYREELRAGHAFQAAVARAWASAGRTVLFSALTVAAALSGLLMFRVPTLTALGAAGVSIAVVCMLASLTFTAALIGLLRRWIKPSRRVRRTEADEAEVGMFARISRAVQRRPLIVALGTMALLLLAGAPLLATELRLPGLEGIPRSIESARVADTLSARFARPPTPAITVVAHTDTATLNAWATKWADDPAISRVRPAQALRGNGDQSTSPMSTVALDAAGDPQDAAVRDIVDGMRANRPPGGPSWVTGDAAVLGDLMGLISEGLPAAIGITVLAMLVLLFAMTGSLVVPVKAIIANLVSLGATFGVLTAVFRFGFGADLLDTLTVGSLNPFVVVIIFAFAFGLSMDYEVFLLGRIKEYVDAGVPTDTAVRRGLQHTGRVITSAALLMVIVFGCFAAARIGNIEQIGLGLSVAVLIDATVVRCLLVPATMTLLGRWNWWAPAWLSRLHPRAVSDAAPTEPAAVSPATSRG